MLFCFEKFIFFSINPKFSILWEFFLFQSRSAANLLPLGNFEKKQYFSLKNPYTFDQKTTFWTFLEILFFQSLFTGQYLPLANSKKLNFFFRKPICFFKQPKFCTFWEILLSQSFLRQLFYLETFAVLRKLNILFRKTQPIFLKKRFLRLGKNLIFQSHSAAKLLLLTIF